MNRASPVDLRRCLTAANTFVKAGLRFVCMPVLDDEDQAQLDRQAEARFQQLIEQAERDEAKS